MIIMLLIKAVNYRILELCKAYNLSINGLANKAGMPPSTVASLLSEKVVILQKILFLKFVLVLV